MRRRRGTWTTVWAATVSSAGGSASTTAGQMLLCGINTYTCHYGNQLQYHQCYWFLTSSVMRVDSLFGLCLMLVAAFILKWQKWPAVIEPRQIMTGFGTVENREAAAEPRICLFKVLWSSTQNAASGTGDSQPLLLQSTGHMFIQIPFNIKDIACTKFNTALLWPLNSHYTVKQHKHGFVHLFPVNKMFFLKLSPWRPVAFCFCISLLILTHQLGSQTSPTNLHIQEPWCLRHLK